MLQQLRPLDPIALAYAAFGVALLLLALPLLAAGDEGWCWLAGAGAALLLLAVLIQSALVCLRVRS